MGNFCTNNYETNNEDNCNLSAPILNKKLNKMSSSVNSISLNDTNSVIIIKNNSYYTFQNSYKSNVSMKEKINSYFSNTAVNFLNSRIKGFLLRKHFKEFIKLDLIDFANELYFQFLARAKNKKVHEIINNYKDKKITKYLKTNWSYLYKEDPNREINIKIKNTKKYADALLFNYKDKKFHSDNIEVCLSSSNYCYKGSVDIYTNKKCGYGELIYLDGSQKMGTFFNDEFIGWNTYVNYDGIIYVGYFIKNKLNGKGIKYNPDNDNYYEGDFANGMKHGFGKDIRKNSTYQGEFCLDKKCGNGEIELSNGDIYKGQFKDNKINGYGHYIWKNNKHEYIGYFLNGKFHGQGYYKCGNNQYFKGTYLNGVKEGQGEIGLNNGQKCFINFVNGQPCGKGTLIDQNQNYIETEF